MKRKILFITGSLDIGGAERQLFFLLKHLNPKKYNIKIFSLVSDGPLKSKIEALGIKVYGGDYVPKSPLLLKGFYLVRAQIKLCKLLYVSELDNVCTFLPLANFMGALGSFFTKAPLITFWRCLTHYRKKIMLTALSDKLSLWRSNKILCNSKAVLKDLIKHDPWIKKKETDVIYNGVIFEGQKINKAYRSTLRKQLNIKDDEWGLIYVANLISYKGHEDLIQAFAMIPHKQIKLFLVGEDRGIENKLQGLAREKNILDRIVFLGLRHDVSLLLQSMDMGIMASHEEGFSNALLEKLEAGLPVVATNVGGNQEALENLSGCKIVPPHHPKALSKAIEQLLKTQETAADKKQRAETVRHRFSVQNMIRNFEKKLIR